MLEVEVEPTCQRGRNVAETGEKVSFRYQWGDALFMYADLLLKV